MQTWNPQNMNMESPVLTVLHRNQKKRRRELELGKNNLRDGGS
jgi:hypothetical protein